MSDYPHGTIRGYRLGCKCDGCKHAAAKYEVRRQIAIAAGKPLTVPNVGAVRRLRALRRIGWPIRELGSRLGIDRRNLARMDKRGFITRTTHEKIVALYDELCMVPGPSNSARIRAANKGWHPPLAWDEANIDARDAEPFTPTSTSRLRGQVVDEVAVERFLRWAFTQSTASTAHRDPRPVALNHRERVEVVCRLTDAGFTISAMGVLLGANALRMRQLIAEAGVTLEREAG